MTVFPSGPALVCLCPCDRADECVCVCECMRAQSPVSAGMDLCTGRTVISVIKCPAGFALACLCAFVCGYVAVCLCGSVCAHGGPCVHALCVHMPMCVCVHVLIAMHICPCVPVSAFVCAGTVCLRASAHWHSAFILCPGALSCLQSSRLSSAQIVLFFPPSFTCEAPGPAW